MPDSHASVSGLHQTHARWEEWETLRQLHATPDVWAALADAPGTELQVQAALRRRFPDRVVRGALNLAELRGKARVKFPQAERMWFDRQGLEQATADAIAQHKAARFSGRVWDYCCGIGADALALAKQCETIAVDRDPAACLLAKWNSELASPHLRPSIVCADVEQLPMGSGFVHLDPDRRAAKSTRVVRIEDYVPGVEFMTACTRHFAGGAIKLSPAANFGGKFPDAEIELVSLHGECKEATVWFGELARGEPWRATVLPAGETIAGHPMDALADVGPLDSYIYDPDPAVVRAGLIDLVADRLGLARLDGEEEYLTGDSPTDSPFVRGFAVVEELPNNPRAIRKFFRESAFGQLEIKCRRIPIPIEEMRRQIPLPGDQPAVLIFARVQGKARAIVCRRAS